MGGSINVLSPPLLIYAYENAHLSAIATEQSRKRETNDLIKSTIKMYMAILTL